MLHIIVYQLVYNIQLNKFYYIVFQSVMISESRAA